MVFRILHSFRLLGIALDGTPRRGLALYLAMKKNAIYLDYNATTPVDSQVFAAMEPYFKDLFGNPSSASHQWGWTAESAVQKARNQVARLIGAAPQEIYFTSGATEANNWALFGLITKVKAENPNAPIHILSSNAEHSSVLQTLKMAQALGVEVDFVPVDSTGRVAVSDVKKLLKPHTKLLSFIWVNNEVGTLNPISELVELAKENKIYLHTDGTQAVGKIPVDVQNIEVDLLSFSAHKIYGPKGVGVLYIRSKNPKVQINAHIMGGGQERGLRSGTLNVPGIVGMGKAAEIASEILVSENERQEKLRSYFCDLLKSEIPDSQINGHPTERAANTLNIYLPDYHPSQSLGGLQNLGVSAGSACASGSVSLSHVLKAMGKSEAQIESSIRVSMGRETTQEEIQEAIAILKKLSTTKETSVFN